MKLRLKYFASIAEQLGMRAEEIELPEGVSTVAALRAHLRARGGAWAAALAEGKTVRASVNLDMAQPATAVRGGDEVAFFPPVTGG